MQFVIYQYSDDAWGVRYLDIHDGWTWAMVAAQRFASIVEASAHAIEIGLDPFVIIEYGRTPQTGLRQ